MYGKSVTRTFLGAFFWAPIPFRQYQNTSGCGTAHNQGKTHPGATTYLRVRLFLV